MALVGHRGVPAIGDSGRAALELPAGLPPVTPTVPDHVLAEYATPDLEIRAASVRGLMHRYREEPRQDCFSVTHDQPTNTTVFVVCDGVGSRPRSHEAAAFVVDRLPLHYWAHRDWAIAVKAVNDELQELVNRTIAAIGPDEDPAAHGMATTLVAVAILRRPDGRRAQIVRSDDSTVWHLSPGGTWTPAIPDPGDPDAAVHTGSVRALPATTPRLYHVELAFDDGALFAMTDGVGFPLEHAPEVGATLATWWANPPTIFEFGQQVGFAAKTHLDDRTVVGAWVVPSPPGGPG